MATGKTKARFLVEYLGYFDSDTTQDLGDISDFDFIVISASASSTLCDDYFIHVSELTSDGMTYMLGNRDHSRYINIKCSIDANDHLIAVSSSRKKFDCYFRGIKCI